MKQIFPIVLGMSLIATIAGPSVHSAWAADPAEADLVAAEKQRQAALAELLAQRAAKITELDQEIAKNPRSAPAFDERGSLRFTLGHIKESIADFDSYLALRPDEEPQHWKRGISYYYADRFDDGQKQFEGYQKFDDNDVENAVWRYLCMARSQGVKKARASILKIKNDRRVPMMQVYELFAGKLTPEQVMEAVKAGEPGTAELNSRLFYAHLYLGLYYETEGDSKRALEHVALAADKHRIGHYMWDVARVHADLLRAKAAKKSEK